MHAGAAPWVRMIRSGLEAQGSFLCFSAVKHLLNICEAAAKTFFFLKPGLNFRKFQGYFFKKFVLEAHTVSSRWSNYLKQ